MTENLLKTIRKRITTNEPYVKDRLGEHYKECITDTNNISQHKLHAWDGILKKEEKKKNQFIHMVNVNCQSVSDSYLDKSINIRCKTSWERWFVHETARKYDIKSITITSDKTYGKTIAITERFSCGICSGYPIDKEIAVPIKYVKIFK